MTGIFGKDTAVAVLTALLTSSMALPAPAIAEPRPIKEKVYGHNGWEVDKTTGANVCILGTGDECQPGKLSSETGGFRAPRPIAVDEDPSSPHYRHVYVADTVASRVQEFDENGQFIGMFGWEVNHTKDSESTSTQAEKNVCTAISKDTCGAGTSGTAAGQLGSSIRSLVVDPANGNIYLAESAGPGMRIQEFTSDGQLVQEIGKEVNKTNKTNICTAQEESKGVLCGAPASTPETGTSEPDAFSFGTRIIDGTIMVFGGPEGLLYVGESGRIQELRADGTYKSEIPLGSILAVAESHVSDLAVDPAGDPYFVYRSGETGANIVYKLNPAGAVVSEMAAAPRESNGFVEIKGFALDPEERLGITEYETYKDSEGISHSVYRGRLYVTTTGNLRLVTEFADPSGTVGGNQVGIEHLAFTDQDDMYATDFYYEPSYKAFAAEFIHYKHVAVAEPLTSVAATVSSCKPGLDQATDATVECRLAGEVNPWGVADTNAWFEWGETPALGAQTSSQSVCLSCGETPVAQQPALLDGLKPDQKLYYRVTATDVNVLPPESVASETASFTTLSVPPRIVGTPEASFIASAFADLGGVVNPENTSTTYWFQYAPARGCEILESERGGPVGVDECPGTGKTTALRANDYGPVPTILQATGLQPATPYRFRLFAENQSGETAVNQTGVPHLPEGTFTTGARPEPEAITGSAGNIGTTSATITGTVNPGGQQAVTYQFQLGVYTGAETQLANVYNGQTATSSMPTGEELQLTELQPGTAYAYRIIATTPYSTSYGAINTFTTQGLSEQIIPPSITILATPPTKFPHQGKTTGRTACTSHKHGKHCKPRRHGKHQRKPKRRSGR